MMFQHANSPGAAFTLLILGTGMNFCHAVLVWSALWLEDGVDVDGCSVVDRRWDFLPDQQTVDSARS